MKIFLTRLNACGFFAAAGFWSLVALYLIALCADLLIPYPYDLQMRDRAFHPPVRIHIMEKGKVQIPFVYQSTLIDPVGKKYQEDTSQRYPIRLFAQGVERKIFGFWKTDRYLFGVSEPAGIHLLGTDMYGRDIFSRIVCGGRISLSISLIGVILSFSFGMLTGGISGYFGGVVDQIMMRATEILMVFPSFYLMLSLRAIFPLSLSSVQIYLLIVVILSFIGWAGLARIIRGMVLSIREEEYVLAARSVGVSHWRILFFHILPNTFSYAITAVTLAVPGYIVGEAALSLLGIGIQEPYPSWGNILASTVGNLRILSDAPWMLLPGLAIFFVLVNFNLLGDALRSIFDPKNW